MNENRSILTYIIMKFHNIKDKEKNLKDWHFLQWKVKRKWLKLKNIAVRAFYLEICRQIPKETDKRNESNCHEAEEKGK